MKAIKKKIIGVNSNWVKRAAQLEENDYWINKSQRIALKILMHIKSLRISQKDFGKNLDMKPQQINKIVRGGANMTLETICKIERELGMEFVIIPQPRTLEETGWVASDCGVRLETEDLLSEKINIELFSQLNFQERPANATTAAPINSGLSIVYSQYQAA